MPRDDNEGWMEGKTQEKDIKQYKMDLQFCQFGHPKNVLAGESAFENVESWNQPMPPQDSSQCYDKILNFIPGP